MPLQHLQLLTVLEANDEIRPDRLLDGNGRSWLGGLFRSLPYIAQRLVDSLNQVGERIRLHRIVFDMRRYDLRRQPQDCPDASVSAIVTASVYASIFIIGQYYQIRRMCSSLTDWLHIKNEMCILSCPDERALCIGQSGNSHLSKAIPANSCAFLRRSSQAVGLVLLVDSLLQLQNT
jgi:hypothetical protein